MELVLARDSVNQVLGYLTYYELYLYGSLSKTCNQSAETEWKRRLVKKCRMKQTLESEDKFFWRKSFRMHIQQQYEEMNEVREYFPNDLVIKCEFMIMNPEFFFLKPYSEMVQSVKNKLIHHFYDLDFDMYDIARNYFERLFPKQYMHHLIMDLYPDIAFYPSENYESGKEEDVF